MKFIRLFFSIIFIFLIMFSNSFNLILIKKLINSEKMIIS